MITETEEIAQLKARIAELEAEKSDGIYISANELSDIISATTPNHLGVFEDSEAERLVRKNRILARWKARMIRRNRSTSNK